MRPRALKLLLRTLLILLLVLLAYLITGHGPRLAIDGYHPFSSITSRGAAGSVLALAGWWLIRRWRRAAAAALSLARAQAQAQAQATPEAQATPVPPTAREIALHDVLRAHGQHAQRPPPSFLLIGPHAVNKRQLLGLSPEVSYDVRYLTLEGVGVFDTSATLVLQSQGEEVRLWRALLDGLRAAPAPANRLHGVVLVLDARQLLRMKAAVRETLAMTLRRRFEELAQRFGNALTVQVVINGCERLPGYTTALSVQARELIVGFAPATRNERVLAELVPGMNALVAGDDATLFERLQLEPDVQVRSSLYGFAPMWQGFGQTLQGFLHLACAQERGVAQVALQSVRFTAQPMIDEVPSPALIRALHACRGHGRVLTALRRTLAWCRARALYLVWLAALAGCVMLVAQHRDQLRGIAQLEGQVALLEQAVTPAQSTGEHTTLRRLDLLADIERMASQQRWLPSAQPLRAGATARYTQALQQQWLAEIQQGVEAGLRGAPGITEAALGQHLGIYLMLGGKAPFDVQALGNWYVQLNEEALSEAQRQRLDGHLQRLRQIMAEAGPLSLDNVLVEQVRARLETEPLAQRLYQRLLEQLDTQSLAPFSIASGAGTEGLLLLSRRSGEPQTSGVAGVFSAAGYQRFNQLLGAFLATELVQEQRLMGSRRVLDALPVREEVLALYHRAYIESWQVFFADLQVAGLEHAQDLPRQLQQLAQPESPLLKLLRAAAVETTLAPPIEAAGWKDKALRQSLRLRQYAGMAPGDVPANPGVHPVTEHFQPLHQWALVPEAVQPLQGVLSDTGHFIQASQKALMLNTPLPANDALQRLSDAVAQVPSEVQPLLLDIVDASEYWLHQRQTLSLQASWSAEAQPFCGQALEGRYPFVGDASVELALNDFNSLFAGEGVFNQYFEQHLSAHIDTLSSPWRMADPSMMLGPEHPGATFFEAVAQVRKAFFPAGQQQARIDYEITPLTMSQGIGQLSLELGGKRLDYRHGPAVSMVYQWPGKAFDPGVRAVVTLLDGRTIIRTAEGPWAWFKWVDQARQVPTQHPEVQQLVLDFEGHEVLLQVRTDRSDAPFSRQGMGRLKC